MSSTNRFFRSVLSIAVPVAALCVVAPGPAKASLFTELQGINAADNSANYDVLFTGTGGNQLSITNVTVTGNIGVGATGTVQFGGPGTITGHLDFSAASSGQYSNTNINNVGPTSVNFGVATVATDLSDLTTLAATAAAGARIRPPSTMPQPRPSPSAPPPDRWESWTATVIGSSISPVLEIRAVRFSRSIPARVSLPDRPLFLT